MNKKALLPLIGLFLLVTGIVLPGSAHAQISEGGTPTSFKYQNTLKSDLPTVQIPINFSVEDLKTVVESRSFTPDRPDNRQCW